VRVWFRGILFDGRAHETLVFRRPIDADHAVDIDETPHPVERRSTARELDPMPHVKDGGVEILRAHRQGIGRAAADRGARGGFIRGAEPEVRLGIIGILRDKLS
jgi:hypothetical protein